MAARRRIDKKQKQVYIICAIVTLVILGVMFGIYKHRLSRVAPVLEIRVENLEAQTPAEAQAACRGDYTRFAEAMEGHEGCAWVWTGKHKLYLVRPEALEIAASAEETGFTAVKFKTAKRKAAISLTLRQSRWNLAELKLPTRRKLTTKASA